jgi:predicted nucleic acid-binding protein
LVDPADPIVDASPLIYLTRSGHLALLQVLGPNLLIPDAVFREVLAKGEGDIVTRTLRETAWLTRLPAAPVLPEVAVMQLGAGESAVLSRAISHPGSLVVLDDSRARRVAHRLEIPTIGTLGTVVRARQQGLIRMARPVIESLVRNGMYISDSALGAALRVIGE